jgi:hypothetical protein
VLDAPVSGGPHDIAAGPIALLVGGDQAHLDRAKPVLDAYGDPVLHLGTLGSGQAVKLVNNALFAANIGLITAAVGLGNRLGIDERTLLSALQHGSSSSRAWPGRPPAVRPRGSRRRSPGSSTRTSPLSGPLPPSSVPTSASCPTRSRPCPRRSEGAAPGALKPHGPDNAEAPVPERSPGPGLRRVDRWCPANAG